MRAAARVVQPTNRSGRSLCHGGFGVTFGVSGTEGGGCSRSAPARWRRSSAQCAVSFSIRLGGLFLGNLMSQQKRLALPHGRGMSLLGSRMLGAERVQFGLLVPQLALHAINFT